MPPGRAPLLRYRCATTPPTQKGRPGDVSAGADLGSIPPRRRRSALCQAQTTVLLPCPAGATAETSDAHLIGATSIGRGSDYASATVALAWGSRPAAPPGRRPGRRAIWGPHHQHHRGGFVHRARCPRTPPQRCGVCVTGAASQYGPDRPTVSPIYRPCSLVPVLRLLREHRRRALLRPRPGPRPQHATTSRATTGRGLGRCRRADCDFHQQGGQLLRRSTTQATRSANDCTTTRASRTRALTISGTACCASSPSRPALPAPPPLAVRWGR